MKQLEGNFYNATPIPRFPGQAPRLSNNPMPLPNRAPGLPHRAPGLPNKNPALPHRAPGLPHRADPNIPGGLPNRTATTEQFRKAQTGMSAAERAASKNARVNNMNRPALVRGAGSVRRADGSGKIASNADLRRRYLQSAEDIF